mgnify:CR=1 FL=1
MITSGDYDSDIRVAITTEDSFIKELSRLSYELGISAAVGKTPKSDPNLYKGCCRWSYRYV